MEFIINLQKDIQRSIERALINFKKCPKDRCNSEYIETKIDNLEKDWILFRKNNSKLYESYKASDLEDSVYVKNDIYANTEESYIVGRSHIMSKLKSGQILASTNYEGHSSSLAKLPKITIPIFSGKYEEWTTFRDLFVSLVHKNKSLDNVQKLHYLKGHLTGEAELLLRHTPIADSNYERCWELLKNRYSNKRFLSNAILNKLLGQRSMKFEAATAIKELLDTTSDCLSALEALEVDVSTWDTIIIHIVISKLDPETRKQWELSVFNVSSTEVDNINLPTFAQFKIFLESRFRALESVESSNRSVAQQGSGSQVSVSYRSMVATSRSMPCEFCSGSHKLSFCKSFAKQNINKRRAFVNKNRMCLNCLGGNHNVYNCRKPTTCRICQRRHHSLLHLSSEEDNVERPSVSKSTVEIETPSTNQQVVAFLSTSEVPMMKQVLLATALIKAETITGQYQTVRALMDQGSQANFITEAAVQMLRLKKIPAKVMISGIGNDNKIKAKYLVQLTIQSCTNPKLKWKLQAYVLDHITSHLPEESTEYIDGMEIGNIQLADPQFTAPRKIDMLLGADIYSQVLKQGIKKDSCGNIVAQNTSLGWILSGMVRPTTNTEHNKMSAMPMHIACDGNEKELVKQFGESEEAISTKRLLTTNEQKCEDILKATTKKEAGGYICKLPFKDKEKQFKYESSRDIVVRKLRSLGRRWSRDAVLKEQYITNEYLRSNYMQMDSISNNIKNEVVYLPHHAVARNEKNTAKDLHRQIVGL